MKYFLMAFMLATCADTGPVTVSVSGEMRKIMQQGDLRATIDLDSLKNLKHLFGLGVAENLHGEIVLLDGDAHITRLQGDSLLNAETFNVKASLLVYCQVESWIAETIHNPILSLEALQTFVEQKRDEHHLDPHKPFPFVIIANKDRIDYHVIDWDTNTAHTPANHKQFARSGVLNNEDVTLIGFYSDHHQGIFTHHNSNVHIHVYGHRSKITGHTDGVQLTAPFELRLPTRRRAPFNHK